MRTVFAPLVQHLKYPANNLIGAFYLLEPTFKESAKRVKEEQGFKFFDARPMEVSPLEINPGTQAIKLEGFGFHIGRIEGKYGFQSFNTNWVDLTMNGNSSLLVMRIGNKFWGCAIVLEPEPGE